MHDFRVRPPFLEHLPYAVDMAVNASDSTTNLLSSL